MTQHVGIFGDSWADSSHGHDQHPSLGSLAWFNRMPGYTASSYGYPGSSLYYSWQKFLAHHADYQRVVFIATNPLRLHKNNVDTGYWDHHLAGLSGVEDFLANVAVMSPSARARAQAMKDYYLHLQDDQVDDDLATLIINDIRARRPDALIIGIGWAHSAKFISASPLVEHQSLGAYKALFLKSVNPQHYAQHKNDTGQWLEQTCVCHLSVEVNELLGRHVAHSLNQGIWLPPRMPDRLDHANKWNYYFSPR
jgi:hypothetical protein